MKPERGPFSTLHFGDLLEGCWYIFPDSGSQETFRICFRGTRHGSGTDTLRRCSRNQDETGQQTIFWTKKRTSSILLTGHSSAKPIPGPSVGVVFMDTPNHSYGAITITRHPGPWFPNSHQVGYGQGRPSARGGALASASGEPAKKRPGRAERSYLLGPFRSLSSDPVFNTVLPK